jgi:hypothetical protein
LGGFIKWVQGSGKDITPLNGSGEEGDVMRRRNECADIFLVAAQIAREHCETAFCPSGTLRPWLSLGVLGEPTITVAEVTNAKKQAKMANLAKSHGQLLFEKQPL